MNEIDDFDEEINGTYTVTKDTIIKEKVKPHFKDDVEHRFYEDVTLRTKADEPILKYVGKHKWSSARDIINDLGMAERTVFHMCNRLVRHNALEVKIERVKDDNNTIRNTRLYRVIKS